jgi:hypothetical protein
MSKSPTRNPAGSKGCAGGTLSKISPLHDPGAENENERDPPTDPPPR